MTRGRAQSKASPRGGKDKGAATRARVEAQAGEVQEVCSSLLRDPFGEELPVCKPDGAFSGAERGAGPHPRPAAPS